MFIDVNRAQVCLNARERAQSTELQLNQDCWHAQGDAIDAEMNPLITSLRRADKRAVDPTSGTAAGMVSTGRDCKRCRELGPQARWKRGLIGRPAGGAARYAPVLSGEFGCADWAPVR
jgi:hypothetical protein